MNPQQIHILCTAGDYVGERVDMPEELGRWVQQTILKRRSSPGMWRFELTDEGKRVASHVRILVGAANESLRQYVESEHRANCFPGAFRDGFARGVHWAESAHVYACALRQRAQATLEALDDDDIERARHELAAALDDQPGSLEQLRAAYPYDTAIYLVGWTPAGNVLAMVAHVPPGKLGGIVEALNGGRS